MNVSGAIVEGFLELFPQPALVKTPLGVCLLPELGYGVDSQLRRAL